MLLKKNKVEIIKGEAFFNDKDQLRVINGDDAQSYKFNNAIVATGSRPIEIKGFKFGGRVLDSTGALNITEVPKRLVVIGGGYIGSCSPNNCRNNYGCIRTSTRITNSYLISNIKYLH